MDISSTTAQVSAPADTSTSASTQTQKSSSKSDSSFKDEMSKVSDKQETKTDVKAKNDDEAKAEDKSSDNKNAVSKTDKNSEANSSAQQADLSQTVLLSGEINLIQGLPREVTSQTQALIDANILLSEVVSTTNIPTKVDYTTIQMDMTDTQFFTELVQNQDKTLQNVISELTQNPEADVQEIQKNIKVSATLMNALSEAVKNKQSFRIDFDKDISVIIKVDRDGAITARFIPGDSAVEQYLKQNMSTLRQRFDEQELAYNELSYTGQQKRDRRNNNNNKENGHE